ncbi:MAG: hypothetical protein V7L23_02750 [Nostoc sp.]|uniref:hypothetical protein n=1 Tax=Nostoc sp. TaxID=1180 RepID=UPI002FF13FE2
MMKLIIELGNFSKILSETEFIDLPKSAIYNGYADEVSINFIARLMRRSRNKHYK